jgi:histidinol-phosphate aminotransferase
MNFAPNVPYSSLLRPELAELKSYVPDLSTYKVRLDANEAPPLLGAEARQELAAAFASTAWERYPDPTAAELREALAKRCGVQADEVLVGAGSDELITLLLTALNFTSDLACPPTVLTVTPTFVMYKLSARARGYRVMEVPLDDDWDLAEQQLLSALQLAPPQILFLASPNNPTGNLFNRQRLERILDAAGDCVCVVDEAYIDYAPCTQLELRKRFANLLFLRTLSKIGFASLRLGWLIGPRALVRELDKVRSPYNVPGPNQHLARLVVTSLSAAVSETVHYVTNERERISEAIAAIDGYSVTPSDANFLWVKTRQPAQIVYDGLRARDILVRSFHERGGRLAHQLRITVGTREENDRLLEALDQLR